MGAFTLPWEHRGAVFRATAMPLLAVIASTLAVQKISLYFAEEISRQIAYHFLYVPILIAWCWLAITVHRLVLLEAADARMSLDVATLRRLSIFAAAVVGVWVLFTGLTLLITGVVLNIIVGPRYVAAGEVSPPMDLPVSPQFIANVANVFAYWFVARVSLMLPMIAIDRKPDLIAAWRTSRHNGWRLAIVVGLLHWCLQRLVDFLYRDGASELEFGVLVVLGALLVVIDVTALSLSYWELTPPEPPPTDPPA